jgi:fructokinase
MLSQLGRRTAFVGKVGADMFGTMLEGAIRQVGIASDYLVKDPKAHTTLAFVHNDAEGDRSFSFYRDPGADELLTPEELPLAALGRTRLFHFGSLSLTREPVRSATRQAVAAAKAGGAIISFDPNLRESLWGSLEEAKAQMRWGCGQAQVVKVAQEELYFLTGISDIQAGAAALQRAYPNLRLLLVTLGKAGSVAFMGDTQVTRPTYLGVHTVDTTGAGDTFCGCCLHWVLERGLEGLRRGKMEEMLDFANAAASLVTAKPGALRSMPTLEEIQALQRGEAQP